MMMPNICQIYAKYMPNFIIEPGEEGDAHPALKDIKKRKEKLD